MGDLEKNIIEQTYRAIEDYDSCKQIANEYDNLPMEVSKFNTLKVKIRSIFNAIQLFITSFIQNNKYKKSTDEYDMNAKTIEMPAKTVNERILAEGDEMYQEQTIKLNYGNLGPIFYKSNTQTESVTTRKQPDNGIEKKNKVWNEVAYVKR